MQTNTGKSSETGGKTARSMIDELQERKLPPDFPVLPDAAPQMKLDVVVNRDNKVWILYDKPFPDYLEWIEFDAETREMTFIAAGGKMQGLGIILHPPMDGFVRQAKEVCVMLVRGEEIRDMGLVPLTVHGLTLIRGGKNGFNE